MDILTEYECGRAQIAIEWVARADKPIVEIGSRPSGGLDAAALKAELSRCVDLSGESVKPFVISDAIEGYCSYGFYKHDWALSALLEWQAEGPPWLLGLLFGYNADAIAAFTYGSCEPASRKPPSQSTCRKAGRYAPQEQRVRHRNS